MSILVAPREHDLGGFVVRRAVPTIEARSVGPFVFVDHMGPALFEPGRGIDVRPHPHIGLATVTYLWAGALRGQRLWEVPVTKNGTAAPRDWFVGNYGRIRTVTVAPNGNLWVTTSNRDGRGEPTAKDDRILEIAID